jgi:steroid 5-alpha reductase family enzyme
MEFKDWLWPSGLVLDAWFHALRPVWNTGTPVKVVLQRLPWTQQLLLGGITVWGSRLFYRIVSRFIRRGRTDDPRYSSMDTKPSEWNTTIALGFVMETVVQSLISLSWSIPLSTPLGAMTTSLPSPPGSYAPWIHNLAIALYTSGLTMEILADWQLASHQSSSSSSGLQRSGVWSIVRHPNYLGDALVHFSFPLLLWSDGLLNPFSLLGPITNYIFLRFIGGDKENETSQAERYKQTSSEKYEQLGLWKAQKNSFWPGWEELGNGWVWGLVGAGIAGVGLEKVLKGFSPMSL